MLAEFSEAAAPTMNAGCAGGDVPSNGESQDAEAGTRTELNGGSDEVITPIQYIVIEMTPVQSIDSTAAHMLEDMWRNLRAVSYTHLTLPTILLV